MITPPTGTLAHDSYDAFFRDLVTAGWSTDEDGHVDSPQGHFALIHITSPEDPFNERYEMEQSHKGSLNGQDLPTPGWYIVQENSQGFVYAYRYEDPDKADAAYHHLSYHYSQGGVEV